VEVSVDGGLTWRRAEGREAWTFTWTPSAAGTYTLRSRAVDDSGNLEVARPGRGRRPSRRPIAAACPCTLWPAGRRARRTRR
jgi:hypothetical protein